MRALILPTMTAGALALAGCGHTYAGEGALAGGVLGAGVGALAGDTVAGAAVGAAAGGVAGATIEKDRRGCYYRDRDGRRRSTRC
ncbi:MAG: glycine zipper domain-containing protein [Novosphingobium sp.]